MFARELKKHFERDSESKSKNKRDQYLAWLLKRRSNKKRMGVKPLFFFKAFITPELNYPKEYFIHYDLIGKQKYLFNVRRSEVIACLDVKGAP